MNKGSMSSRSSGGKGNLQSFTMTQTGSLLMKMLSRKNFTNFRRTNKDITMTSNDSNNVFLHTMRSKKTNLDQSNVSFTNKVTNKSNWNISSLDSMEGSRIDSKIMKGITEEKLKPDMFVTRNVK